MSKAKHTEGDWYWKQTRGNNIYDHQVRTDHVIIAELDGDNPDEIKANAAYIIKACNNYPEMVELLKRWLNAYAESCGSAKLLKSLRRELKQESRALLAGLEE